MDRILVPFEGEGSGEAPLTWGQMGLWQSIQESGESRTVGGVSLLPPTFTVEDMVGTLAFMMGRHQALRSRLRFEPDGTPRQVLSTSGEVPLEVVDAGDADPAGVAEEIFQRHQRVPFDYEHEWPVRMAVIRSGGILTHLVAVYLHLALDATGVTILIGDAAARDPVTGEAAPVTATPPLEQARRQAGPAARRQNEASLRHFENVLRTVPASRFGEPRYDVEPSWQEVRFRSPATLLAARAAAARGESNTSSVLLASFAVALARFTDRNPVMTLVMVSNRFRPGFAQSVSAVAQISPIMIDVADATISEAVARAGRGALNAYKSAYYNPYEQDEVVELVTRDRGEEIDFSCYYNDRRQSDREQAEGPVPTEREIRDALARSSHVWENDPEMSRAKLYLHVDDPPGAIDFVLSTDARWFSADDTLAFARAMEAVAVDAALDPTAATGVRSVPAPV